MQISSKNVWELQDSLVKRIHFNCPGKSEIFSNKQPNLSLAIFWEKTDQLFRPVIAPAPQWQKKQKKLQYLSHHNWWTASKNISIKYPNIFVSAKRKNIFFFSSEEKNTKLWTQKYTLSSQLLGFVGYSAAVFPKIAARSGAFLAHRGPCAVSREGYSGWHRLAMVEWTWCQCWECPIPLPKGYRVQHCQHPGSNHYC